MEKGEIAHLEHSKMIIFVLYWVHSLPKDRGLGYSPACLGGKVKNLFSKQVAAFSQTLSKLWSVAREDKNSVVKTTDQVLATKPITDWSQDLYVTYNTTFFSRNAYFMKRQWILMTFEKRPFENTVLTLSQTTIFCSDPNWKSLQTIILNLMVLEESSPNG